MIQHNVDTRHSRRGWEVRAEPQQRGDCPQVRMQGEAGLPLEAECQAEEFGLYAADGTRRGGSVEVI